MKTNLVRTFTKENGNELLTGFLRLSMPSASTGTVRPPIHLSIVIDCSGSMSGDKIELTKKAAANMLQWLTRRDFISIVTFSSGVDRIVSHTPLTDKPAILKIIDGIYTSGSTNLSGGLLEGLNDIALNYQEEHIHYVILLTDGQANIGVTDHNALAEITKSFHERGINTTTFGFGTGFEEELLTKMASAGGGRFAYISNSDELGAAFQNEFGALTNVVVQNVGVSLKTSSNIELVETFGGFPGDVTENSFNLKLGDGLAEDTRHLLFQLRLKKGKTWPKELATLTCRGIDTQENFQSIVKKVVVKIPPKRLSASKKTEVLQELWLAQTMQIKDEALLLADQGNYSDAEALLKGHANSLNKISGERQDLVAEQQNLLTIASKMKAGAYNADFRKKTVFNKIQRSQNQGASRRDASFDEFDGVFYPEKTEEIANFVAMLKRKLTESGFAGDSVGNAMTVFSELAANAINHGCKGHPEKKVNVFCRISDTFVLFRVCDDGPGFNPKKTLQAIQKRGINHSQNSRGLILINHLCARITYSNGGREAEAVVMKSLNQVSYSEKNPPEGVRLTGKMAIVSISGDLSMFTLASIKERINLLISHSYIHVIIDGSGITSIDSTGLSFFIYALKILQQKGGSLAIANPNLFLSNILRLIQLDTLIPIYNSVEDALEATGASKTFTIDLPQDNKPPN